MNKMGKSAFAALLVVMLLLPMIALADNGNEEPKVAKIGETEYVSLADAVSAANGSENGAEIKLLADITLGAKLTISGDVTISGAHTITRADSYTGTFFAVNAGAVLTLDDGLIIDGGNNYEFKQNVYDADFAAMELIPKTNAEKYFTPEEGAPVANAFMITLSKGSSTDAPGGTVNLNKVTIQNNYSIGSGIVSAPQYTTVNLKGAKVTHVAATQGNGVVVQASGAGIKVNVEEGTLIDGNHVGGNHGIFKVYSGTVLTMNGGKITNTTGWNSNGTVAGMYYGTFIMNGGEISGNTGVYGPDNGRNAAIYLHSGSAMEMNGGIITNNAGRSRGGIDSSKSSSKLTINGGEVSDNISLAGTATPDVGGTTGTWEINDGTFTQDVSQWCPEGKAAVKKSDGTYDVVTGSKIFYYTVELDEAGHIASKTRINIDAVMGEAAKANSYIAKDEKANLAIYDWYEIKEKQANPLLRTTETYEVPSEEKFDFSRTLKAEDVHLCGFWEPIRPEIAASPDLPQTGDNSHLAFFVVLLALSAAGMVVSRRKSEC